MTASPIGQVRDLLLKFPRDMTVGQVLDTLDQMAPRQEAECISR